MAYPANNRRIVLCVVLICVAIVGFTAWMIEQTRLYALEEARRSTDGLAQALEHHTARAFEGVEFALSALLSAVGDDDPATAANGFARHSLLARLAGQAPHIKNLFIFDRDGNAVVDSLQMPSRHLNVAKRSQFQAHMVDEQDRLIVGAPQRSHLNGQWMMIVSRRITARDGGFGGIVSATIDLDYFSTFYRSLDRGTTGAVSLLTEDGALVVREPNAGYSPGQDLSRGAVFARYLPTSARGSFDGVSSVTGAPQLVSYRKLAGLPLVVVVSLSKTEALRTWSNDVRRVGIAGILLLLLAGILGFVTIREVRQRSAAEVAMRAALEDLERQKAELAAAAENIDGMRLRAEEALDEADRANRAKSTFLAHMSHELRTPLNAINGFSEIIADRRFGPGEWDRYCEYARDIHNSGMHLLGLINAVLDLSKIEAGRMELDEEAADLRAMLEAAVKMVEPAAATKSLALRFAVPANLPRLFADERKLVQSFLNVLSNAVKFTPAGGAVSVAVERAGSHLAISFRDTGVGMSPEDLACLFIPFAQINTPLTRTTEGTGLGMALTKSLVALHGGTVDVESLLGSGTTVTIRLPVWRLLAAELRAAV